MAGGSLRAQDASGKVVVRLDPALDSIVSPDAKLEKLLDGKGTFEGPTWVHQGRTGFLIFSDIPGDVINKLEPDGTISVFLGHIFTGTDPSTAPTGPNNATVPLVGSNGTTLDRQGRVVFCAYGNHTVERLEKDGTRTVLADRFEGKRFNTPNDLVVKSDGSIYFTDTQADRVHADNDPRQGLPFTGVYLIKDGKVQSLAKDLVSPNGLAFAPGEKYLYVNESQKKRITRFDVQTDDTIANPHVFIDMTSDPAPGVPDGMKVDKKGNVYCTGPGGLWIMSPDGKHIGTILTPLRLTNLTFGGADGKTLYITSFAALYRIQLKAEGLRP